MPPLPITVSPRACASSTAAMPTPPVAPWTRTVSPGRALRALKQRAIRRAVGHAERRALPERHARRQLMQLRRAAQRELGVRAGAGGRGADAADVDAIASRETLDVGADRLDFAGAVLARRVGQRRLARIRAGRDVRVDRIHARGAHAHDDVARSRLSDRERLPASAPRDRRTRERESLSWCPHTIA